MSRKTMQDEALIAMRGDRVDLRIEINLMENSPLSRGETQAQRAAAIRASNAALASVEGRITERRKHR
jgi:hypothetical protein